MTVLDIILCSVYALSVLGCILCLAKHVADHDINSNSIIEISIVMTSLFPVINTIVILITLWRWMTKKR